MQIEHSDGELDRRPSSTTTQAKEILHTEILSTESAMPKSEPPPAPKDTTTTANPGTPIGCPDGELDGQRLGELLLEGTPIGFSHSKSPKTVTDSVCELPRINLKKVQQSEREGGDRALTPPTSSELVNVAPDMASNMDLDDGGEQVGPNAVEVVLDNSPDISRKGKRKMIDRGDDTNNPAGEGGFKKTRITTAAEEDSDIEYICSWRPPKTRTKIIQTAVKMENVPIKLENPVSDSVVSAKSY